MRTNTLILSSAGGVLAASTLFAVLWSRDTAEAGADAGRLGRLENALLAGAQSRQSLASNLDSLVRRMDGLETRVDRRPATEPVPAPARQTSSPAGEPEAEAADFPQRRFLDQLADAVRTTRIGVLADQEEFWLLARTTGLLDEGIEDLRTQVDADPGDDGARMLLADAYVAKLLTVPIGPERGIWGERAEVEWQTILEHNPQHWEAQYVLAYNYSMYPDFVAKTDEALEGFERAVQIQEGAAHRPERAQTYVQLARMYEKKRQLDKAREALDRGAARHPGNEAIAAAIERLRDR
jgi:tetratricopeptide (TPR) repeat protein